VNTALGLHTMTMASTIRRSATLTSADIVPFQHTANLVHRPTTELIVQDAAITKMRHVLWIRMAHTDVRL